MAKVEMYTARLCGYCDYARRLLTSNGIDVEEFDVTFDAERRAEMEERLLRRTVPQIFIDGVHIGGCGELDRLLGKATADAAIES